MPINNLIDQLKRDEGEVLHVYRDSRGILTAGVGHNCEVHNEGLAEGTSITQAQSDSWLYQDIGDTSLRLSLLVPWSTKLDEIRRAVFQNMGFNMGVLKLLGFHHMLGYSQSGNYTLAASEMLKSLWATQVGDRAKRLSVQLESGTWQ